METTKIKAWAYTLKNAKDKLHKVISMVADIQDKFDDAMWIISGYIPSEELENDSEVIEAHDLVRSRLDL
jgi:vacuolar-type H+-ATPase subunit I/STV1